MPVFIFSGKKY